jgi:hypothetical protein
VRIRHRQQTDTNASRYRIFFATDIHGSERCFRKFLAAAKVYRANALVLGGDIAGKAIVPIVHDGPDEFRIVFEGMDRRVPAVEVPYVRAQIEVGRMPMAQRHVRLAWGDFWVGGERDGGEEVGAVTGGAVHGEDAADGFDPVFEADEASAAGGVGATDAVVSDRESRVILGGLEADMNVRAVRVLCCVG